MERKFIVKFKDGETEQFEGKSVILINDLTVGPVGGEGIITLNAKHVISVFDVTDKETAALPEEPTEPNKLAETTNQLISSHKPR